MTTRLRLASMVLLLATPVAAAERIPEAVRDHVVKRVERGGTMGIVVGVVDPDGSSFVARGRRSADGAPVGEDTLFEIGSITKVFTAALLADLDQRGLVGPDEPLARLLPPGARVPARGERQITPRHLATHRSGLPRLPEPFAPPHMDNPYAAYSEADLLAFLAAHALQRDPGAQYEYSNLGVGLLGHALALRAGKPYEQLLRERVLTPLGMTSTGIVLTEGMKRRMSEGHDPSGRVVPLWDLPTLAGAGALRSSLDDMMKFASAVMSPPDNAIGRAIRLSVAPRFRVNEALSLGLNWHRVILGGDTIIFHNGGTAGFRTYLGVNPRRGVAVVLLGNSAQDNEDIARHVLVPSLPLIAIVHRKEIALPADVLAQYVGEYRLLPQLSLTVTLEGNALQAQPTGQPKFPLFAEARDRFFLKVVDAQIEFRRDSTGAVTGLTLFQNGNALPGSRTPE
jgi:CubicO group peptidase (beta-lactamase class C family)